MRKTLCPDNDKIVPTTTMTIDMRITTTLGRLFGLRVYRHWIWMNLSCLVVEQGLARYFGSAAETTRLHKYQLCAKNRATSRVSS